MASGQFLLERRIVARLLDKAGEVVQARLEQFGSRRLRLADRTPVMQLVYKR